MRYCNQDLKDCPCRIVDVKKGFLCDFLRTFADLGLRHEWKEADKLLDKICPELKTRILVQNFVSEDTQKQKEDFLKRVAIGDLVYCASEIQNVFFLRRTTHKYGNCKYMTFSGEIKEAPTLCFRIISRGDKYAQYKTKNQQKADYFDHLARRFGFRVEKTKLKDSYLLKIYGDTLEEVNDFVLHLKNNQVLGY